MYEGLFQGRSQDQIFLSRSGSLLVRSALSEPSQNEEKLIYGHHISFSLSIGLLLLQGQNI